MISIKSLEEIKKMLEDIKGIPRTVIIDPCLNLKLKGPEIIDEGLDFFFGMEVIVDPTLPKGTFVIMDKNSKEFIIGECDDS